mgnify:CR=1 FL=1
MKTDIINSQKATIGVEKTVNDKLIPAIDESKYMGLHNNVTSRPELFNFALALGLKEKRTKINRIVSLWRWEQMSDEDLCIYDSIWFSEEKDSNNLQGILSGPKVISIVEEYANTGFQKIENTMDSETDENFAFSLILEMNEIIKDIDSL